MKNLFYLAPVKGTTDKVFREIFPQFFEGFDFIVAPFLTTKGFERLKASYVREFEVEENKNSIIYPQILTENADNFIELANLLFDNGYENINWNLGCPYPMAVKKGRGAGMIPFPEKVEQFLEKVIPELKSSLSIKVRLGMKSSDEIFKLIPVFNRFNLSEIIIHARTADQMYDGDVNIDAFEKCIDSLKIPVVYNGDIKSFDAYNRLKERLPGVNRWMIGRGVLQNPFLIERIKFDRVTDEPEMIERIYYFQEALLRKYSEVLSGPAHLTDKMKNLWMYLSESFENSSKIRKKIKNIQNENHYVKVVDEMFHGDLIIKQS